MRWRAYRFAMRLMHRFNLHHTRAIGPLLGVAIRNLNECLDATARADRLERLVRAAAPFVNGVAVIANTERDGDMTPALEWLADAAQTLGTLPPEEAR